jgi:hypothetical protein
LLSGTLFTSQKEKKIYTKLYVLVFTVAPYNPYYSPEEFTYQQEDSIDTSVDSQEHFLG